MDKGTRMVADAAQKMRSYPQYTQDNNMKATISATLMARRYGLDKGFRSADKMQHFIKVVGYVWKYAPEITSTQCNFPVDEIRRMGKILVGKDTDLVYWPEEIYDSAIQGSESFVGATIQPYHIQDTPTVWHYQAPYLDDTEIFSLQSTLFIPVPVSTGECLSMLVAISVPYGSTTLIPIPQLIGVWRAGEVISEDNIHRSHRSMAALEFMRLPIIGKEVNPIMLSEVKDGKKDGWSPSKTYKVYLRRVDRPKENRSEPSDREYSCQWFRRGHWRRLPQPRKVDGSEVTYVQPAICGPPDKPLKTPAQRIIEVRR